MIRLLLPPALLAAWLAALAAGGILLSDEAPGPRPAAPGRWPDGAPRDPVRPTALLFAHPRCPCIHASLHELRGILDRVAGRADVRVVFVLPPGAPVGWERGPAWDDAGATRGAAVVADPDGREARRFGATTSGQFLVYGPDGRLRFAGGITGGRGRHGASPGRDAALAALTDGEGGDGPVFGCPLFGAADVCAEESPCKS